MVPVMSDSICFMLVSTLRRNDNQQSSKQAFNHHSTNIEADVGVFHPPIGPRAPSPASAHMNFASNNPFRRAASPAPVPAYPNTSTMSNNPFLDPPSRPVVASHRPQQSNPFAEEIFVSFCSPPDQQGDHMQTVVVSARLVVHCTLSSPATAKTTAPCHSAPPLLCCSTQISDQLFCGRVC